MRLSAFLDADCDLANVPNLLNYALVLVTAQRTMTTNERDALIKFFLANYAT